ncbi:MAG: hypothetical protein Crog4KO_02450 [Crocinitomicaceae bacterium]
MKKKHERREAIIDLLLNRAALKQDIADYSEGVFESFKVVVQDELKELKKSVDDSRIRLSFEDKGKYEFQVFIGSDTLVFQLHPNIFRFDDQNPLWETDYLKENGANGFFGVIQIFNFLAESMEQSRMNDVGYLIGRMFMNHNYHFMLEGKGPIGTSFVDLENSVLTDEVQRQIVQTAMAFAINFDLVVPPYKMVQQISVGQIQQISSDLQMATGKRLGFKFSAEDETIF